MTPIEEQEFMLRARDEADRSVMMLGGVLLLTAALITAALIYVAFLR